jgi:fluoroquinolone transport system ATP-binding protein
MQDPEVAAIDVMTLRVRYPGAAVDAVAGVDLRVEAGEVFGLLGPNGAGKTTTQLVLTSQVRRFRGRVSVLGKPVQDWGQALYEHIGVGFELPAYFPKLTGRENLAAFARLYADRPADPMWALEQVGLAAAADQRVAGFSKGMKMRLNLARAVLHRPKVLFLDEPTSGLDPAHAAQVRELIETRAAEGSAVLLTTHDMATVEAVCRRVAFMRAGRIVATGTPGALRREYGRRAVVVEYVDGGGRLASAEFPAPDDPALLALLAGGQALTVHSRDAPLSEVFVALAGASW